MIGGSCFWIVLTGKELLSVISLLPEVCTHLWGLLLSRHDLSKGGETLVQAGFVKGLPMLKSLVLGRCRIPGAVLADIISNTTKNIELVDIAENDPITDKITDLFEQINNANPSFICVFHPVSLDTGVINIH